MKLTATKNFDNTCERCNERKATVSNDVGESLCRKCLKEYVEWGKEIEADNKRFNI